MWPLFKLAKLPQRAKQLPLKKAAIKRLLLTKVAAIEKRCHHWKKRPSKAAKAAAVEKQWLHFKLTHIASEAKAAAVEKAVIKSSHQKSLATFKAKWPLMKKRLPLKKVAIKSGHLWGNVATF
jgi:hypothetical protein